MPVLSKGTDFTTGDQVAATSLDNLVDSATFASGAVDNSTTALSGGAIIVKDAGITSAKLSTTIVNSLTTVTLASGDSIAISDVSDSNTNKKGLVSDLYTSDGSFSGQLKFPATQSASADANTLDDYEEGTWTPSLGGTAAYTSRTGTYTKIGRKVTVHCDMTVNTIGSGSTYEITGTGFTAANGEAGHVGYFTSAAASFVFVGAYMNGSAIRITGLTAAGASMSDTPAFFGDGTRIKVTVTYNV